MYGVQPGDATEPSIACDATPAHGAGHAQYTSAPTVLGVLELKNSYHTLSEEEKAFRRQLNPPRNPKPRAAPPQALPPLAAAASTMHSAPLPAVAAAVNAATAEGVGSQTAPLGCAPAISGGEVSISLAEMELLVSAELASEITAAASAGGGVEGRPPSPPSSAFPASPPPPPPPPPPPLAPPPLAPPLRAVAMTTLKAIAREMLRQRREKGAAAAAAASSMAEELEDLRQWIRFHRG